MTKQERRKARHQRRVSRRALLKSAGAAVAALAASIIPFGMVHQETSKLGNHPTWDHLLNHYGRRPELDRWINGLVAQPSKPQPALLLVGSQCSGKSTFHEAMSLLLPEKAVLHYPQEYPPTRLRYAIDQKFGEFREVHVSEFELAQLDETVKRAWMIVIRGQTENCVNLFERPTWNAGRYLKWCLTSTRDVDDDVPNVQRHNIRILNTTIPRPDLLRRLEDERDAFCRTLLRYAA